MPCCTWLIFLQYIKPLFPLSFVSLSPRIQSLLLHLGTPASEEETPRAHGWEASPRSYAGCLDVIVCKARAFRAARDARCATTRVRTRPVCWFGNFYIASRRNDKKDRKTAPQGERRLEETPKMGFHALERGRGRRGQGICIFVDSDWVRPGERLLYCSVGGRVVVVVILLYRIKQAR